MTLTKDPSAPGVEGLEIRDRNSLLANTRKTRIESSLVKELDDGN